VLKNVLLLALHSQKGLEFTALWSP